MGDDQLAVVEDVVAHQPVKELGQFLAKRLHELRRARRRFRQGEFARPCVIWTSLPRSFRISFMSWLPGTHRAEPQPTMLRTSRTVSRMRGPRSTKSPTKTALRPSGWRRPVCPRPGILHADCRRQVAELLEQGFKLIAAAVNVADDVEGAMFLPFVIPQRHSLDRGRFDLLGAFQHKDMAEAFPPGHAGTGEVANAAGERREGRSLVRPGAGCGPGKAVREGSARWRPGGSGTCGQARQRLAGSGCTLVASMTVSRPKASRWAAMKWRSAKASFVTAWLFSSSLTMPRQASDDSTSVGKKCLRANVLLPDPLGPIRTTRDRLGMEIFMFAADSHCKISRPDAATSVKDALITRSRGSDSQQLERRRILSRGRR